MDLIVSILVGTIRTLLYALDLAMLGRALISWLPVSDDNRIVSLLYAVTEPLIYPVRALLERFELFRNSPIDISFTITSTILLILTMVI